MRHRVHALARRRRPVLGVRFARTTPTSGYWGIDRGTPVDRVYIHRFLEAHADAVAGDVLEVRDSAMTDRFGGTGVRTRAVLDVDPANPAATIVGDLGDPSTLPAGAFDCVILTQVLQYVADARAALANAYVALRPGGTLLVTVPMIQRVDPSSAALDRWRFTRAGVELLVGEACPGAAAAVHGRGNLAAAVAFLDGVAAEELKPSVLALDDEPWAVVVTAMVRRPEDAT
jgi:SAM-dependent methyltransferase